MYMSYAVVSVCTGVHVEIEEEREREAKKEQRKTTKMANKREWRKETNS